MGDAARASSVTRRRRDRLSSAIARTRAQDGESIWRTLVMTAGEGPLDRIIHSLQERAKELNCLYRIDEALHRADVPLDEALRSAVAAIPPGWQFPAVCAARIVFESRPFESPGFAETPWMQSSPILAQGAAIGRVDVVYTKRMPDADEGPFLKEERKLLDTIAERIAIAAQQRKLASAFEPSTSGAARADDSGARAREGWRVILDFLAMTDRRLLQRIARRMANHLNYLGIEEARLLLEPGRGLGETPSAATGENRPSERVGAADFDAFARETFRIAAASLSEVTILPLVQKWIREDHVGFLAAVLEVQDSALAAIAEAVERFRHIGVAESELPLAMRVGLRVALIRRVLTDQFDYIRVAKRYLAIDDFGELLSRTITQAQSRGKLGGKGAGMILAQKIISTSPEYAAVLSGIKVPRTWYLPSDALIRFIRHNDLEDVYNWKYLEPDEIRREYPHIVQVFKSGTFPPEVVQGLSMALDDIGERPIIVRSSSLLEDRWGAAFSGKYKSLFLANRGEKSQRLAALMDAVAEVYASVFGPDPIEYRAERGLLDTHEEMGIMIQEVVGTQVGRYFLPAFSGVAFSNNEFRWSPRIAREDGLLRLVPGLGTRAVDRTADDYPVLIAPGQPGLRASATIDEIVRYSPARIDAIDLEAGSFVTLDAGELLREHGDRYPAIERLVSVYDGERVRPPSPAGVDFANERALFTFDGLVSGTPFVTQMRSLLRVLSDATGGPVDIEFASDGRGLYVLQCRPQSFAEEAAPTPIPRDLPDEKILFTARRYISNGRVPDITHIVYVDPEGYADIGDADTLHEIARAVGRVNRLLPKRQFVLMGPGRWGSRGDIRLGVPVTYADINNTAALIEIARRRGNYVPDLSFGTHFFQDLVEAGIRYIPLYPDDPGVSFNAPFFRGSPSVTSDLVPDLAHLSHVLRVIDLSRAAPGQVLRILMNGELQEAVGLLASAESQGAAAPSRVAPSGERPSDDHWRWRLRYAQTIASALSSERFGVKALYLFGSTKNATAGPASDIDLIVHFSGTPEMRKSLEEWLEGWSLSLAEMSFQRTGYRTDGGLLDVHIVTDADIAAQTSYAAKIGAVTDAARPLPLRSDAP
jgi:hypothetical protein